MSQANITFRLDIEKRVALDGTAMAMDCGDRYRLNEAARLDLDLHQWQLEASQQGMAEAEAGAFASDEAVATVFARLTRAAR